LDSKTCTTCARELPATLEFFWKNRECKFGVSSACKECGKKQNRDWYNSKSEEIQSKRKTFYDENPDRKIRAQRQQTLSRYGMTLADYEVMFQSQSGACKICGRPENDPGKLLSVDHCHDEQGFVRGLLCRKCNTAIGLLREDPAVVQRAADYVMTSGFQRMN